MQSIEPGMFKLYCRNMYRGILMHLWLGKIYDHAIDYQCSPMKHKCIHTVSMYVAMGKDRGH